MTLAELSGAATPGKWSAVDEFQREDWNIVAPQATLPVVGSTEWTVLSKEDADFIVRLVNAYRAGELVEVQVSSGAVDG